MRVAQHGLDFYNNDFLHRANNKNVDLGSPVDVAVTPKTKTAVTGVFYSDIERVLQRPDTPAIFPNKQVLLDLLRYDKLYILII